MTFGFFSQLSNITGLPPLVLICALVILIFLITFIIYISVKLRNIRMAMRTIHEDLDNIVAGISGRSGESAFQVDTSASYGKYGDQPPADATARDLKNNASRQIARRLIETKKAVIPPIKKNPEVPADHRLVRKKIVDLLKKSGKPTAYHDLTNQLTKNYPAVDNDYFLKELEGLQKEGRVQAQLVSGKLFFQVK